MLKIILADNQAIFRAGAAKVLAVEDDIRVVAQAENKEKLFSALNSFKAAVVIVAESLDTDVPTLIADAKKHKTSVVVIGDSPEEGPRLTKAGAHAVIYRNVSGQDLLDCVRKVGKGEHWAQQSEAEAMVNDIDAVGARVRDRLTPKELKIVALIVQGYKNKEIATKLGTTEQVIKNYLRNVYDKIGVSDRLELALFTIHHKILLEAASATGVS